MGIHFSTDFHVQQSRRFSCRFFRPSDSHIPYIANRAPRGEKSAHVAPSQQKINGCRQLKESSSGRPASPPAHEIKGTSGRIPGGCALRKEFSEGVCRSVPKLHCCGISQWFCGERGNVGDGCGSTDQRIDPEAEAAGDPRCRRRR